jgi:hypothetical protein
MNAVRPQAERATKVEAETTAADASRLRREMTDIKLLFQ